MADMNNQQFAEDASKAAYSDGKPKAPLSALLADIQGKFTLARNARQAKEAVWNSALRQFRGIDNEMFRQSEHSKASLDTTRVKTKAAIAQIVESLFTNGKYPIRVEPSEVPDGTYAVAHIAEAQEESAQAPAPQEGQAPQPQSQYGFDGDGRDITLQSILNPLGQQFVDLPQDNLSKFEAVEGPGLNGEPTFSPAKEAAVKMEKAIKDQLDACHADAATQKAVYEQCILGTGALKGPFNTTVELPRWETEGGVRIYRPKMVTKPVVSFVSIWDLYLDPSADTSDDLEWVIERHKFSATELRKLKRRPLFITKAIDALLTEGPNYEDAGDTDVTRDDPAMQPEQARQKSVFEVFEYWGYVSVEDAKQYGLPIKDANADFVQVNVWYSGSHVLRIALNPFEPNRIPYYIFPYETDPYSIYGIGVPTIMEDQQKLINGFLRMAVDNLALAGNLVFEIDEASLVPGQSMEVYPGKIFRRLTGAPGTAVTGIKFPSTANDNIMMVREVRAHADEATGIPSIAHGQSGVTGYGRTSSGMSMLLNNASLNIKSVVRNIDNFLIVPLAQAMFAWNMQFNYQEHPDIVGDLEIRATGASGLEMKDVENQRLQTFLQMSMNPAIAPLIKLPTIIKRIAQILDMEPDDILNTPEEAMVYAQIMGAMGAAGQQPAQGAPMQGGMTPPMPGQPGFTGNDMSAGNMGGMNGGVEGVNAPIGG